VLVFFSSFKGSAHMNKQINSRIIKKYNHLFCSSIYISGLIESEGCISVPNTEINYQTKSRLNSPSISIFFDKR
jgi:hypothetical protein